MFASLNGIVCLPSCELYASGITRYTVVVVVVESLSLVWFFATPWTSARQASLSFTISQSLLKLMSIDAIQPSSSSVVPFSSCPQSFPASGSFPMSRLFASGGQSIGASASASVLPMNIQGWCPLGLTGLISLKSKECSESLSNFSYGWVFSINVYLEGCVIFFFSGTCNLLSLWCCPQVLWNDSMPHSLFLFSALFSPHRLL